MIVGGIDLGLRKVHVFAINDTGKPSLFHVELKRDLRRDIELKQIFREVRNFFADDTAPFFMEEPVVAGSRNLRVSLGIAQTAGAVVAGLRAPVYLVPVSSWKKATVGIGHANKDQVSSWLSEHFKHYSDACARTNSQQDYVDAACIALYGSQVLGLDLLPHRSGLGSAS